MLQNKTIQLKTFNNDLFLEVDSGWVGDSNAYFRPESVRAAFGLRSYVRKSSGLEIWQLLTLDNDKNRGGHTQLQKHI